MAGPDIPEPPREPAPPPPSTPGFVGLLSDLIRDLTEMVQGEFQLARVELGEAAGRIGVGVELMVAGGLFLLVACLILAQAAVLALVPVFGPVGASALVAGICVVLGLVLVMMGRASVRSASLLPRRTLDQTSRDVRLAKEQL